MNYLVQYMIININTSKCVFYGLGGYDNVEGQKRDSLITEASREMSVFPLRRIKTQTLCCLN